MNYFDYKGKKIEYLTLYSWEALYSWYKANVAQRNEMWLSISRSWPPKPLTIGYIDAVEVALCFGWIDSTNVAVNGLHLSRFSPRNKRSHWTELNKARCRRLVRLGKMTEYGEACLPNLDKNDLQLSNWILEQTYLNPDVKAKMQHLPPLYIRVRLYNIDFNERVLHKTDLAQKQLNKFIEYTLRGETYGEWNDHGRLSNDE